MRNPTNPVHAGANLVDHDTLSEGEIDALIAEHVEDDEDEVVDMDEAGEMIDDGDDE